MHILVGKLQLQLQNELVDNARDDVSWQISKGHCGIEAVAEFRRKHFFNGFVASVFLADIVAETNAIFCHVASTCIGCHDQNDIAEVDSLAMMIGQATIIHHLQQDVEKVGMRLFYFIEQQHAVRALVNSIGQQPALIKANIARGRTDQTAHAVTFHIF